MERFKELRAESADEKQLVSLRDFLQSLSNLFLATKVEFDPPPATESFEAPLLNGDFELNAFHYWSDELGVSGEMSRDTSHRPRFLRQNLTVVSARST